jgi:hypothetical protein
MTTVLPRKREQIGDVDAIDLRQLAQELDAGPHRAALDGVQVRAIEAGPLGHVLDAQLLLFAQLLETIAERFLQEHGVRWYTRARGTAMFRHQILWDYTLQARA